MTEIKMYEKKDGTTAYMFSVYLGMDELTGKVKTTTRRGFQTQKEARLAMSKLLLDTDKHGFKKLDNKPFKAIYKQWYDQYKSTVKESTYTKTDEHFTLHILPEIGSIPMNKLKTIHIQTAVNKWFKAGLTRYKRFYNYINRVLTWAYKMQIINDNPASRVILPVNTSQFKTMKDNYYDLKELKHFFECLNDLDNPQAYTYFRLLAFTGMRKGESLALLWTDIDFNNNQISITKTESQGAHGRLLVNTPKTDASVRVVNVDDKTMSMLKEWRKTQRNELLMLGFNTINKDQLVFSNNRNTMLVPTKPRIWLQLVISRFDLKNVTVHAFRRTFATLAIESGASLKEVQAQLGHSSYKTTADVYTEVTKKQRKDTAQKYANYVDF